MDTSKFMMGITGSLTLSRTQCGLRAHTKLRKQVIKSIVITFSLCLPPIVLSEASAPQEMWDPIFGLKYQPGIVKFEVLPDRFVASCHELSNANWDRKSWTFARVNAGGSEYTVIGGYFIKRATQ